MDIIFHEKQDGALCAQHCLNSLLQGPYYTAVDLADFAKQLDEAERERMQEGDVNSQDYLKFMQQPSSNMDDSGFFSIQVICKALQVWGLDLLPFNSPGAALARQQPVRENAFICNLQQHWFTIRKLGRQWFNLNSTQSGPLLVTETYLSLFLAQLEQEGYSIFIVKGTLPPCDADRYLMDNPVSKASAQIANNPKQASNKASSSSSGNSTTSVPAKTADPEEVRRKRMQYFDRMQQRENLPSQSTSMTETDVPHSSASTSSVLETEEEMLQAALAMSMKQS